MALAVLALAVLLLAPVRSSADEADAATASAAAPADHPAGTTAMAAATDDLDLPPVPLPPPVAVKPIAPSDLPPPNVFSSRGVRALPAMHFNMAPGHLDTRDHGSFRPIIDREAAAAGVPPELVDAVMSVESGYNPATIGGDGEIGLMQVLPSTARMLGFTGSMAEFAVPENNIHYGVMYLAAAWRLGKQDICTATMKYRAGLGEVRFSVRSVNYCLRVRSHLAARGVVVTGTVPEPTFGQAFEVASIGRSGGRSSHRSMLGRAGTVNFAALNAKLRDITDRIALRTLHYN